MSKHDPLQTLAGRLTAQGLADASGLRAHPDRREGRDRHRRAVRAGGAVSGGEPGRRGRLCVTASTAERSLATRVSLSPEEFREHLKLSSATAGLELPDLDLPAAHHVILRGHALPLSRLGHARPAARAVPARRRAQRPHLGPRVRDAQAERHCLALDQRGHGDSEWSPVMDYATESHAGDLDAFVDHLGLDRFVLVGMSLGGANALAWAGGHSRRLAGARARRRRPRDAPGRRAEDRRVHVGGHAARLGRGLREARAGLQPAP